MSDEAQSMLDQIIFVFQPVVNIYTGYCIGYEAFARDQEGSCASISCLYDEAFSDSAGFDVELGVMEKVLDKYLTIPRLSETILFLHLDPRVGDMPGFSVDKLVALIEAKGLQPSALCYKVAANTHAKSLREIKHLLQAYRKHQFRIALHDFGADFSGIQLLYHFEPNFVRINRYFLSDLKPGDKKAVFVSNLVDISHNLEVLVIGEGVETEEELNTCKQMGCDFVQGYLIQEPQDDVSQLTRRYQQIEGFEDNQRREGQQRLIAENLQHLKVVNHKQDINDVLEMFQQDQTVTLVPVIGDAGEPLGLIRETTLKKYVYSRYGQEILRKQAREKSIVPFISRCPISEITSSLEKILEIYSMYEDSEGILITENAGYVGFLSAQAILRIINARVKEANLVLAATNEEIDKYLKNVNQGLLLIDARGTVGEQYSAVVPDLFGHNEIAHTSFVDLFFDQSQTEKQKALTDYIELMFSQGITDLVLIQELNPVRHYVRTAAAGEDGDRFLEVDFKRIYKGKRLENIMAVVTDVTRVRRLQEKIEADEQRRQNEVEQLQAILGHDPDTVQGFIKDAHDSLDMIQRITEELEDSIGEEALAQLFRDCHSLKGNAASFQLEHIAQTAHHAEDILAGMRKDPAAVSRESVEKLKQQILKIAAAIEELDALNQRLFNYIRKNLDVGTELQVDNHKRLHQFLQQMERRVQKMCADGEKSCQLVSEVAQLPAQFTDQTLKQLKEIIVHLVNNAVDHGIESKQERTTRGKQETGKVVLRLGYSDSTLNLDVADDGRGVDLDLIRRNAVGQGFYREDEVHSLDSKTLISLLFRTGFSTAADVTQTSGRGVGMDVVKENIARMHGKLAVSNHFPAGLTVNISIPL